MDLWRGGQSSRARRGHEAGGNWIEASCWRSQDLNDDLLAHVLDFEFLGVLMTMDMIVK